jgi:CspA family cold shock protein
MIFKMSERVGGAVKWFSNERGYGFVTADNDASAKEYFVHYSYVKMNGYKTLKAGQKVSFVLTDTDRGVQAQDVDLVATA